MSTASPHAVGAVELRARLDRAHVQRQLLDHMVDPGLFDNEIQTLSGWASHYLGLSMAALAVAHVRQATDALGPVENVIDAIEAAISQRFGHDLVTAAAGNVAEALLFGAVVPPATIAFRLGRALDALYDLLSAVGRDIAALDRLVSSHSANRLWHDEDQMRQLRLEFRWEQQRRRYERALRALRGQVEGKPTGFYRGPSLRSLPEADEELSD